MPTSYSFADLEIRILDLQDQGYPVEITLNSEQEFPRGHLDPARLADWAPTGSPASDGEFLFQWLFADSALAVAWAEARGQHPQRRIRLRIDAQAPELHTLPWELLRDPGNGIPPQDLAATAATPFSRYLAGKWQPGGPIIQRPIKILVAVASPTDLEQRFKLAPVNLEQEWQIVQKAAEGAGPAVELTLLPQPCTLLALEAELKKGYHVLHFVGHGAYSERTGTAALLMANDANQATPVRDDDMVAMLARQLADADVNRDDKLRLVFLASCQSATRSSTDSFRGLAPKLVAAGVPAVLAMQEKVPIVTAQAFAATFYQQLLNHGHVDLASNEARSAVLTANLPGAAIPVLFSRLRSGQLLGRRGRITGTNEQLFWPFLLKMIDRGLCVPFLGPAVTADILPPRASIAQRLATEYNYPLSDSQDLSRVAQFVGLMSADLLRSDYFRIIAEGLLAHLGVEVTGREKRRLQAAGPSEVAMTYSWADRVLQIKESEIHHLLADMELPLYITTNADSFMYEALKHKDLNPRRIGPRWEVQAGTPQWSLTPPPTMAQPVVLHLNGYDGDPEQSQHLVLGQDEFMAHLVRLYGEQESILPTNVLGMLSQSSYLFLGYQLDDWEFRAILHGLIKRIAETNRENKVHVGVQLELDQSDNPDTAMEYLSRYMGRFNINIYWGSSQQFVTELHTLWQRYLSGESPS